MNRHFTFKRNDRDFTDILSDPAIKKYITMRVSWSDYLMIGLSESIKEVDKIIMYINIKYGDDMINENDMFPDRTPRPNIDYTPKRD